MELQPAGGNGRKQEPIDKGTLFSLIEIDCANTMSQVIPGGYIVPAGVHRARVRKADVPAIKALVEPLQDRLAEMFDIVSRDQRRRIEDGLLGVEGDEERAAKRAELIAMENGSVAGRFQDLHDRALLPFARADVIEDDLPAPVDEEKATSDGVLAKQIIAAVQAGAGATAGGVSIDAVEQIVAKALAAQAATFQAKIDALEEERTKPALQAQPTKKA